MWVKENSQLKVSVVGLIEYIMLFPYQSQKKWNDSEVLFPGYARFCVTWWPKCTYSQVQEAHAWPSQGSKEELPNAHILCTFPSAFYTSVEISEVYNPQSKAEILTKECGEYADGLHSCCPPWGASILTKAAPQVAHPAGILQIQQRGSKPFGRQTQLAPQRIIPDFNLTTVWVPMTLIRTISEIQNADKVYTSVVSGY